MARKPRALAEGDVIHARTRFVNEEFRIQGEADRRFVLSLLPRARRSADVLVLAFALMSSHIHLLLRVGVRPIEDFYRPFHTALAMKLNYRQGRFGPVVAGRPWIDVVKGESIFGCLRYVHENQKEAGVAPDLRSSDWTSHPLFVDPSRRPGWLDVHQAALLAGFAPTELGVTRLVRMLERLEGSPMTYAPANREMRDLRQATGAPVELATPVHDGDRVERPLVARAPLPLRPVLELDLETTAAVSARTMGVGVSAIRSRLRSKAVSSARALAIFVWSSVAGHPAALMAAYLGISEGAASQLRRRGCKALERALPHVEAVMKALGIPLDVLAHRHPGVRATGDN